MSSEKAEYSGKTKISGHVYSKRGAVLNGAKVTCDGYKTLALADGSYVFNDLPPGTYEVSVSIQGFQAESMKAAVKDEEAVVLDFQLSAARGTARIRGCVHNELSKPMMGGGSVILILPIFNIYAQIDAEGYYEFANLPAGTYTIYTSVPEYEDCKAALTLNEGESKTHDFFCKDKRFDEPPWG